MNFDEERELGFLKRGIRELGWGFCSEDAILVGSALVPFGLIFPYMGCKLGCLSSGRSTRKGRADLVLGITDAHGKPLECKSCCLEVVQLKLARERPDFWALFSEKINGGGLVKIRVSEVRRRDEWAQVSDYSDWIVLLRGISSDSGKEAGDPKRECIVDRVLELLCCMEKGEFMVEQPFWQLLLAFLFRKNYWASVSISDSDGNSLKGVLKPFTVNYALLGVTENNNVVSCQLAGEEASKTFDSGIADSSKTKYGRRKRNKMDGHLLQDVTWSTFYKAVFRQDEYCAPEMDLEEMYFATKNTKSKKLSFLKCWMREMKKSSDYCQIKPNEPKTPLSVNEEVKERLDGPDPEPNLNASSSPDRGQNHNLPLNQEFLSFSCKEHWEAFLKSIPQKIEHGTFSKEVDLWNLAKRLVSWSIDALYAKFANNEINNSVNKELDDCSEMNVRSEVSRLLLMKPKDLLVKHRSSNSESATLREFPANYSTENIIRQHELQILFRMELLRSKIAVSFEENLKQKMVKEICSLLQNIEFYLQGDFLCGESLLEFAGKTIKSRYARSLGDVIHKIYEQMEFFSFDDNELEASESLLVSNSEEAKRDENESNNTPKDTFEPMTIASSSQNNVYLHANDAKELQPEADNLHDRRLMKAHKQRDRARRLSSFTSWVPDLHRVWALKHPGMEKPALDYLPSSKCKKMKRERNKTEVVCETPMSRKQHLHMQKDEGRHLEISSFDDNAYRSLSKALFLNE
ncbi:uncharacterized protein LOC109834190 [Asparagus officinalis]|nr:uncharacterized protein LOC109834190 [Asparagus officinalis]